MSLVSGIIREITLEGGVPMARVSVEGAITKVPLVFVKEAVVGDTILISSGVAITRIQEKNQSEDESDVSGHSG